MSGQTHIAALPALVPTNLNFGGLGSAALLTQLNSYAPEVQRQNML